MALDFMYEQEVAGKNSKKSLKNPANAGFFYVVECFRIYILYSNCRPIRRDRHHDELMCWIN